MRIVLVRAWRQQALECGECADYAMGGSPTLQSLSRENAVHEGADVSRYLIPACSRLLCFFCGVSPSLDRVKRRGLIKQHHNPDLCANMLRTRSVSFEQLEKVSSKPFRSSWHAYRMGPHRLRDYLAGSHYSSGRSAGGNINRQQFPSRIVFNHSEHRQFFLSCIA